MGGHLPLSQSYRNEAPVPMQGAGALKKHDGEAHREAGAPRIFLGAPTMQLPEAALGREVGTHLDGSAGPPASALVSTSRMGWPGGFLGCLAPLLASVCVHLLP